MDIEIDKKGMRNCIADDIETSGTLGTITPARFSEKYRKKSGSEHSEGCSIMIMESYK